MGFIATEFIRHDINKLATVWACSTRWKLQYYVLWLFVNIFSQIMKSITCFRIFCQNNCIGHVIDPVVIIPLLALINVPFIVFTNRHPLFRAVTHCVELFSSLWLKPQVNIGWPLSGAWLEITPKLKVRPKRMETKMPAETIAKIPQLSLWSKCHMHPIL